MPDLSRAVVVKYRLAFFTTPSIMWSRKLNLKAQKFYRFRSQIVPRLFDSFLLGGGVVAVTVTTVGISFLGICIFKAICTRISLLRECRDRVGNVLSPPGPYFNHRIFVFKNYEVHYHTVEKSDYNRDLTLCKGETVCAPIPKHFARFAPGAIFVVIIFFWRNQRQHLVVSEVSIQRRDGVCRFWS